MATQESPTSTWLPIVPAPSKKQLSNPSFDAGIDAWEAGPDENLGLVWGRIAEYGQLGATDDDFSDPLQIASDASGNTYIADSVNNRVIKRNSAGAFVAKITGLTEPSGVAADSAGNLYVVSFSGGLSTLKKYNSSLALQWTQTFGTILAHAATDGTHVYVTDFTGDLVWKRLCSTGAAVSSWGTAGSGDGQFDGLWGIAYNAVTGTLFTTELTNDRIQEFTTAGVFVRKWGSFGSGDGQFASPVGIAPDADGNLWVTDPGNDRMQRFSPTGTYQMTLSPQVSPQGITVAPGDLVWVTDTTADNLAKWAEQVPGSLTVVRSHDLTIGGAALGSMKVAITANAADAGASAQTRTIDWFPTMSRESIEFGGWVTTDEADIVPRLQIIFGDANEAVVSTETEALWSPVAGEEYTRVFAARVPDRATQYRLGFLVYAVAAGATGAVWLDDIGVNQNYLIVSDVAMGELNVTVQIPGRWL